MIGIRKKRVGVPASLAAKDDTPMVGSKRVYREVIERFCVTVPYGATPEEELALKEELTTYAALIGYSLDDEGIQVESSVDDGERKLWFNGVYAREGTDYNPMVFSNITWVSEHLQKDNK